MTKEELEAIRVQAEAKLGGTWRSGEAPEPIRRLAAAMITVEEIGPCKFTRLGPYVIRVEDVDGRSEEDAEGIRAHVAGGMLAAVADFAGRYLIKGPPDAAALSSNQAHWKALALPTPWIDDEADRTNYLLLCIGQMRETRTEAVDLLGDDGASLGLVEAIKRRNFLLTEARDQRELAWKVATDAQNDRDAAQRRVAKLERAIDEFITAAKGTRS